MRNNSKEIQVLTLKPESLFVIIKPAALTKEVIYRNNEKNSGKTHSICLWYNEINANGPEN